MSQTPKNSPKNTPVPTHGRPPHPLQAPAPVKRRTRTRRGRSFQAQIAKVLLKARLRDDAHKRAKILAFKYEWVSVPNWVCIAPVFSVLSRCSDELDTNEFTKLPSRAWSIEARKSFLTPFDYDVYLVLLKLLRYEDEITVTYTSITRELGRRYQKRLNKRIENSLRRLGWESQFRIDVPVHNKETKVEKVRLLTIKKLTRGYSVRHYTKMLDFKDSGNYGLVDFYIHRELSNPLAKGLYRYIVGQKRGMVHNVDVDDLRVYLGYWVELEGQSISNFEVDIRKALREIERHKMVSNWKVKDGKATWKYL